MSDAKRSKASRRIASGTPSAELAFSVIAPSVASRITRQEFSPSFIPNTPGKNEVFEHFDLVDLTVRIVCKIWVTVRVAANTRECCGARARMVRRMTGGTRWIFHLCKTCIQRWRGGGGVLHLWECLYV